MNKKEVLECIGELATFFLEYKAFTENMTELMKTFEKLKDNPSLESRVVSLRVGMWTDFCSFLIDTNDEALITLFESFADVTTKHKQFTNLKKEYEKIDENLPTNDLNKNNEALDNLKKLYKKLAKLREDIDTEKDVLVFQGRLTYITKVFIPIAGLFSAGYVALIALNFSSFENLVSILIPKEFALITAGIIWVALIVVCYYLGKRLLKMKKTNKIITKEFL